MTSTKRFSTFEGVFTPTFLSILGVVMYLRLGWVVGQVGLMGALVIIGLSNMVTLLTGLSISSITTNVRIGAGGAYALISKSLGLEVGGAIGIPLYLSQAISVAFYITGFTECWVWVFPQHNFILVSLILWLALLIISYLSAKLAFRLQYVVMVVIGLSLVSVFSKVHVPSQGIDLWHGMREVPFWGVFAIFFPAVTGILAGVSMSGELTEPERSIPRGALSAIVITAVIYFFLAVWFSRVGASSELVSNTTIIIDKARWKSFVIAGIMGATLSSALSMLVAAPRTLFALSRHRIVPLARFFNHMSPKGEPTPAILLTALISLVTLSLGTLNSIASVLTMFFLITYGTLNVAVFIEKGIGLVSFRPTFKIPLIFSFAGGLGCFYAMFLIDQFFSLIAIAATIGIYLFLLRRQTPKNWPDVRKGLFIFIGEQALKIARRLPYHPKIWKPNLLIPVGTPKEWTGLVDFIRAIAYPSGRVEFLKIMEESGAQGLDEAASRKKCLEELALLSKPLCEEGILSSPIAVASCDLLQGASIVMETLKGSILPPNVFFVKIGETHEKDQMVRQLIEKAVIHDMGVMVLAYHPKIGFGQKSAINLWIRQGSPNVDLAVLTALQLEKNWDDSHIRLLQTVCQESEKAQSLDYLSRLKRIMRLPADVDTCVLVGSFEEQLAGAPVADINIFGMAQTCDLSWLKRIAEKVNTSVLLLRDSKQEDAIV